MYSLAIPVVAAYAIKQKELLTTSASCQFHADVSLITQGQIGAKLPRLRAISVPKWYDQFSIFLIPLDIS